MRRRSAHPSEAGMFASGAIEGAILAGIVIPVVQYVFLAIMDAMPEPTGEAEFTFSMLYVLIIGLGFLPVISTIAAMCAAYLVGGPVALVIYIFMAIGASALLGAPVMGLTVIFLVMIGMIAWLALQSRKQRKSRRMY